MKIKVRIFGEISTIYGTEHALEFNKGATIRTLTNVLRKKAGKKREGYLGDFKVGGPDLAIIINGKNIAQINGVDTILYDKDFVVIMPYVVGG